ncbi:hypothetical protein EPA93_19525 [Ktedonosporobacter rubrisoli]|uniref:Uncharacterized protein n=1 Tax=Ktedonosporobacter rubrisoli TaxID=2509675 RepID=A0A4P6JT54_KTERU|nr:hypothetical protein [Ktedonosporobacter rubrisoli]QBD78066.1 hypothetical protein EPA93_19525 [Ktedonosporobacter rubrisoli]
MMREDSIEYLLSAMDRHQEAWKALQASLITRAKLQAYTESQYDEVVLLAKEGLEFIIKLQAGDTISAEWVAARDNLVARAQRLILDPDT